MDSKIYPVITLYQPWATWIMRGWKTIETRTHSRFSGLLHKTILIHAGQKTDEQAINNPFLTKEQLLHNPDEVVNGYILGSVYVDAVGLLCGDDFENKSALIECKDRYGLFLTNVTKLEVPRPCKGSMGIWYFDIIKNKIVKKEVGNG